MGSHWRHRSGNTWSAVTDSFAWGVYLICTHCLKIWTHLLFYALLHRGLFYKRPMSWKTGVKLPCLHRVVLGDSNNIWKNKVHYQVWLSYRGSRTPVWPWYSPKCLLEQFQFTLNELYAYLYIHMLGVHSFLPSHANITLAWNTYQQKKKQLL